MKSEIKKWRGVPIENEFQWRKIFNNLKEESSPYISEKCPICSNPSLRRYFSVSNVEKIEIRGEKYKGRGNYWAWCSSCFCYEHMSCYVPEWWNFIIANLDNSKLTAIPDLIDEKLKKS